MADETILAAESGASVRRTTSRIQRIAFQGEPGAYSEAAIFEHFGPDQQAVPCRTFDEVFSVVVSKDCDLGLVPIENSLAGSIHRNYDLLLQNPLEVIGEHNLHVRHCLIARPGVKLSEIKKVISHPQALAQCEVYLRALPGVAVEQVYDTAGSVKMVRDLDERDTAAIASRRAAQIYGMEILAEHIEDNAANFTRFLVISRQPVDPGKDAKTSIVFSLRNQPGSLFKAMSVFALRDIDLTKIESRPLAGKPWEYFFYIDFIGSVREQKVERALAHLEEYSLFMRVLGSYPRHVA
jgi:prephenate dehydratase